MVVPRAGPPVRRPSGTGRAGLGPPAGACCRRARFSAFPSSRPSRRRRRSQALPPDVAPRRKAKREKAGEHSRVWTCAHPRFLGRPAWEVHMHAMQVPADTPNTPDPLPVGRAVGGGHVLPVAPKTHACLPACFPVHLSSKRTWTRAGSRPAAMSPRVPQSSPQTPRRPKYADEQKAQSVQPWPHHIHDTVEYFVHSGTLSIPRPWICPPWPSPSPSPSG